MNKIWCFVEKYRFFTNCKRFSDEFSFGNFPRKPHLTVNDAIIKSKSSKEQQPYQVEFVSKQTWNSK